MRVHTGKINLWNFLNHDVTILINIFNDIVFENLIGERPFTCSACGRGFTTKFNMQKHEMTHDETRYQGEPQHECEICHKKFHLK